MQHKGGRKLGSAFASKKLTWSEPSWLLSAEPIVITFEKSGRTNILIVGAKILWPDK